MPSWQPRRSGDSVAHAEFDNDDERARNDVSFLHAVRAAYSGTWDVLDALWWQSHPDQLSPAGIASPAVRRRELQRRIFAADGDAVNDAAATELLRQLDDEIRSERAALDRALASVRGELAPSRAEPSVALDETQTETETETEVDDPQALTNRRRLLVTASLIVAVAIGAVAGAQLTDAGTSAAPIPTATTEPTTTGTRAPALTRLDLPQATTDAPTASVPEGFVVDSFRLLGTPPGYLAPSESVAFYAARATSGMVCLIALGSEIGHLATCVPESNFPTTGLRLYWLGTLDYWSDAGVAATTPINWDAVWKPDGSFQSGGSGPEQTGP
ncbi:hypothetical protein E3O06_10975 [Cryobacterium glaciale]|uniref:Uncharacterized protein n=1 Tax=Cryobacterium glaciale TaxID=1259145 RepID=A0A4R8UU18_9MICO|nr:hypothetical protein [Cryobacterium glaciale]TFB71942.1 hypothetical protein E3O06_10975 [Cryobacterium glaciale]